MSSQLANKIIESIGPDGHVIWDWNGTLLNDVDHAVSTMNYLLTEHDLAVLDRDRYRMIFDFPVLNYYSALGFDFKKESFESLCHRFVDRFMAGFRELPLFEEVKTILMELHALGMRQSILSATVQSDLDEMIGHFGLREIFAGVYGIDNKFAGSKIERGREMVRSSGVPLTKTLIVGDTLHDLEVATELGIHAILVSHGHQCPTRFRNIHKEVIEIESGKIRDKFVSPKVFHE